MPHPSDALSPALESLLTRFAEMVRAVGRRHGLSPADVDEVFQDVRIRLWRVESGGSAPRGVAGAAGGSEKAPGFSASYVYRTAVSAALDLIRRRRARPEEPMRDALEGGERSGPALMAASASSPEQDLDEKELVAQVMRAVEQIPASRRPVVRMYLAGYHREEIAELLGWTEAKTRNLLYRGLGDLRERLTAQGIGPGARR